MKTEVKKLMQNEKDHKYKKLIITINILSKNAN